MNKHFMDKRKQEGDKKQAKEPQFQWITEFGQEFAKLIKRPIQLREGLMKNNQLQRCLQHNIISSIYCTICRRILCASCMYSSTQHRKHRVIPIENATDEIRQDLKSFSAKIPRVIQQADSLVNSNNQFLMRIQRDFNPILLKLQQFYENLRNYIKIKQKQQLGQLRDRRQQVRSQFAAYNNQLSKVQQYVTEKYKSYANSNLKYELILPARNILENLLQANVFVKEAKINSDSFAFKLNQDQFKDSMEEISYKISGLVPEFQGHFSNKTPRSSQIFSKSVDVKVSKGNNELKKIKWQKTKNMNSSSVAGMRSHRNR